MSASPRAAPEPVTPSDPPNLASAPKAVIDTNVFVSGVILPRGVPFGVLEAWRGGRFDLVISGVLFQELADVLRRPRLMERYGLTEQAVSDVLSLVQAGAWVVVPATPLPVWVRDPKDERVLAAALAGEAGFLVTGDDDLLSLDGHPELGALRIVTPRAFLDALDSLL